MPLFPSVCSVAFFLAEGIGHVREVWHPAGRAPKGGAIYTERVKTPTTITRSALKEVRLKHAGERPAPVDEIEVLVLQRRTELNRLENQLNRLDLDWAREKKAYMVSGGYGHHSIPTKAASIAIGVSFAVLGPLLLIYLFGLLTNLTWSLSGPPVGPPPPLIIAILGSLLGILFVILGIGLGSYCYRKAEQYEQARQAYKDRRIWLLGEIETIRSKMAQGHSIDTDSIAWEEPRPLTGPPGRDGYRRK
jgi:hypothetical protein